MKINLLEISNFKRLGKVIIEPGGRSLILIGGKNTAGKSSLMGSMGAALGGKREVPEEPIRHGADKASIRIEFDDGALVVRRKFTKKSTSIEVTSDGGVIKSPQKMLDKLVGARFLDPMKFSRLPGKEQREVMLGCVELGIDLDENIAKEKAAYDERRDLNRHAKKLEAKLDGMGRAVEIPDEMNQEEILERIEGVNETITKAIQAETDIRLREAALGRAKSHLEDAQKTLAVARDAVKLCKSGLDIASAAVDDVDELRALIEIDHSDELQSLKDTLAQCAANNVEVAMLREKAKQYDGLEDEFSVAQEESRELTQRIEIFKDMRTEALESANMPIAGLTFDEEGLQLNGTPFDQASGAEKLRASIAIAWALQPELQDIWVEDGALLDEDSLEMVREFAEENDLRIWLERVGDSDEEAIIMVDGEVQ